mgnify:CR=1 FL=1
MLRTIAKLPTFRSLEHKDWAVLWMAGNLWHLAFWMDLIVLGWLVLELTNSPFLVALVGTFRLIPMGIFGFLAGSIGDRLPKKSLLLVAQTVNLVVTAGFAIILLLDLEEVWVIYVTALLTGSAWAIDFPIRRAFIRDLLPVEAIVNAMAIDAASLTGMAMAGRWIGGGFLEWTGPEMAYIFLVVCYIVGFVLLLRMPNLSPQPTNPDYHASVLQDIVSGLAYVLAQPSLRAIFLVTVLINFFVVPYFQLTPVFAKDVFDIGPGMLGMLSGMDGFGALAGTCILASMTTMVRPSVVFAGGSLLFGLGVLLFSQSPTYQFGMMFLFVVGLGTAGFATMQTTITVTQAEPNMRGRAMGAIALGIGMLPIGMAFVGGLAQWLGAPKALGLSSLVGLGLMTLVILFQPSLRRVKRS